MTPRKVDAATLFLIALTGFAAGWGFGTFKTSKPADPMGVSYEQEMQQILDKYQPEIDRASDLLLKGDAAGSDAIRDCVTRLRGAEIRAMRQRRGLHNPQPVEQMATD